VDKLEADFAMRIVDQGPGNRCAAVFAHRKQRFSPDLIDETIALWVAAGPVDLVRKIPQPCVHARFSGFSCHLSARASHEIDLQFVHRT
jgi:hypothetical protein